MKHAAIKLGDYFIPLIGIPRVNVLEECDVCHEEFSIQDVKLQGTQFLCEKHQSNEPDNKQCNSAAFH